MKEVALPLSEDDIARRIGRVTASRIADVTALSRDKKGYGVSRAGYMAELICERLTGVRAEGGFESDDMRRGNEVEPEALRQFELWVGERVTPGAFFDHPTIAMAGATTDAFVGDLDLAEIKSPKPGTHFATLKGKNLDGAYFKQGQWQLACHPDRRSVYHVSFDPRWPPSMRLAVKQVYRDEQFIETLEREVRMFIRELEDEVNALRIAHEPGALVDALARSGAAA
jgi:hypothetical protein